jgi:large subunit ribosomal protein L43
MPARTRAGNGRSKPIDVKNLDSGEIAEHVSWLRSSHGRGQDYKVTRARHLSRNPSIQGMWNVDTFAAQLEQRNARLQRSQ